jgi:hypothetical protein
MNRATSWLAPALLALALAGCTPGAPPSATIPAPTQTTSTGHINPGQTTQPVAGLTDMPAEKKTSQLDSGFVTEWPVVDGTVTDSHLVGPDLIFTVDVPAPASSVEAWYRTVMRGRAFILRGESKTASGGVRLDFSRAGIQYVVLVKPTAGGVATVKSGIGSGKVPTLE